MGSTLMEEVVVCISPVPGGAYKLKSYGYRRTKKKDLEDVTPEDCKERSYVDYAAIAGNRKSYGYSNCRKRAIFSKSGIEKGVTLTPSKEKIETSSICAFNKTFSGSGAIAKQPRDKRPPQPGFIIPSHLVRKDVWELSKTLAFNSKGWDETCKELTSADIFSNSKLPPTTKTGIDFKPAMAATPRSATDKKCSFDAQVKELPSSTYTTDRGKSQKTNGHATAPSTKKPASSSSQTNAQNRKEMDKLRFERCAKLLAQWYNRIPIVQAYSSMVELKPTNGKLKTPRIFEQGNQLDIRFVLGHVSAFLTCPLCKGLFFNVHTIRDCLHSFCKSCLVMYTVEYGLSCPKCNRPLPSDGIESIGYDNNLQSLVDKLFPAFQHRELQLRNKIRTLRGMKIESKEKAEKPTEAEKTKVNGPAQVANDTQEENCMSFRHTHGEIFYDYIQCNKKLPRQFDLKHRILVALLSEEDHKELNSITFDEAEYLKKHEGTCDGVNPCAMPIKDTTHKPVYLSISRTDLVSDLCGFVRTIYHLSESAKMDFLMGETIMHHNHTVYFICRMIRADPNKCVLIRYRTTGDLKKPKIN